MEPRDAERLAKLTKEVVELVATLLLSPLKLLLRRLMPGSTPMDEQRWTPVADEAPAPSPSEVAASDGAVGEALGEAVAEAVAAGGVATPARATTSRPRTPSPHDTDLTGADAARLREAEREAQASPDGPGPELHVEQPWPGYDAMNIGEVLERLTGADQTTRAMVRLYEETHKNRKGVLRGTE
jgi:hypothetical protein